MSARDDRVEPLVALHARTALAIDDLASFRSGDPAAAQAVQAARLTAHTLRSFWIPGLDEAVARSGRTGDHHGQDDLPPAA